MIRLRSSELLSDGRRVRHWQVRNESGSGFDAMDLGAGIRALLVPDRSGVLGDVVLGFEQAQDYLADSSYFGATIGRFANRIARGQFALSGQAWQIPPNNGPNALHGGPLGYDKRVWEAEPVETTEGSGIRFTLNDPEGEQGFPGAVEVAVTYVWAQDDRLIVAYEALSDAETPFNITHHGYWNLAGTGQPASVLDHHLRIAAEAYLPVDATLIPTGELRPVQATPFDFRVAKPIGRDIAQTDPQLAFGSGYDHCWVLAGTGLREVAQLADPASGRLLTVTTDMPGMQVYSGNFIDGSAAAKHGCHYPARSGLALETQFFPDSPNQPHFPPARLTPGIPFRSRTVFAFDTLI
jgi:aldose 1-epimerase